ncbi:hypothetical protein [Streptomyces sp. rh34]|uniref:hypothetical protein n=1 Tax=Streptomyces sp. rh34 TaxID=2034272 RepID=UPI000BF1CC9B|nr:hypothetical protein [Streptomyces sp. rh34]
MQPLNRVDRQLLAPGAYQTYSIAQPPDTLVRTACEQAGCVAYARGWQSTIDESTPLGQQQAAYIRGQAGRTFREQRTGAGLTVFTFEARQRCFTDHQTRPQLFAVRDGDWRGNPTGRVRQHQRPADWVEDMAEGLDAFQTSRERG